MRKFKGKILFIIGSLARGGAETHLSLILPELVRRGWGVTLLYYSKANDLRPVLETGGVEVKCLFRPRFDRAPAFIKRPWRVLQTLALMMREFRRNPADITHFFLPESYMMGMFTSLISRDKSLKIMSRRSLNRYKSRRWAMIGKLENRFHPFCDTILANSQAVLRELRDMESVPSEKLGLIYNGINLSKYEAISAKKSRTEPLTFVIVANLIPYKGHRDLIQAFGMAVARGLQDFSLWIIGEDLGIGKDLKDLASSVGIQNQVRWLGKQEDVSDFLANADVGILCSHEEGFSNAILEYMAAGLPVIATDVGGNAEAVVDGKTGLIVPPSSPERLKDAILSISQDVRKRTEMGAAARQRALNHFSLSACVDRYESLYLSLIQGTQTITNAANEIQPTVG